MWKILRLNSLELVGLDLDFAHEDKKFHLKVSCLQRLCLESCTGSNALLTELARKASASSDNGLRLTEFKFRIKHPPQCLRQALESFLCSFSGLNHLSVLVDYVDSSGMPSMEYFLASHTSTLKTLVWESRLHPRLAECEEDTSHNLGLASKPTSELVKLLKSCTQLVELGIAFDWLSIKNAEEQAQEIGFLQLPCLKTLHLRNSPLALNEGVDERSYLCHMTKARAIDFLDAALLNVSNSQLDLLIIGPLTFRQR